MSEKMSDGRRLRLAKGLRASMPDGFPCKAGCFSCCKVPVAMLKVEWDDIVKLPQVFAIPGVEKKNIVTRLSKDGVTVTVQDERGWCPFVDGVTGACHVYSERPLTCRAYGQSALMRCREEVVCPPELNLSTDVIKKHGRLAEQDMNALDIPDDELEALFWAMDEWRRRNPGNEDRVLDETTTREQVHPLWHERFQQVMRERAAQKTKPA